MIETTIISQFWGILLVTLGALYLLKKNLMTKVIEESKDEKFSISTGFMVLMLGIATFLLASRGEILLKLLGILSFVKGIVLISCPKWRYKFVKPFEQNKTLLNTMLIILILVGLYLLFNDDFGMRYYYGYRRF